MNLESSKNILKITGILTLIGGVLTVGSGILGMVMGKAATTMPEITADAELSKGAMSLLYGGGAEIIAGILTLFEGWTSYSAGKHGKHVNAAVIFAVVGLVMSVMQGISLVSKGDFSDTATVIGTVLALILNLIILMAARKVKAANQ